MTLCLTVNHLIVNLILNQSNNLIPNQLNDLIHST